MPGGASSDKGRAVDRTRLHFFSKTDEREMVSSERWGIRLLKKYGLLTFAVLYLISPIDAIPDVSVPVLEHVDDTIVLVLSFLIQRRLTKREEKSQRSK